MLTLTITINTLGAAMRHTRREAGLSTAEMAEAFEVTEKTIHRWETDKSVPPVRRLVLAKWAEMTGMEPDFFGPFLVTDLHNRTSSCMAELLAS